MGGLAEYGWALVVALVGALMWASQVPPKQVVSHVAAWACAFGLRHPPGWLCSDNADRVVRHFGTLLVVGAGLYGAFLLFDVGNLPLGPRVFFGAACALVFVGIIGSLVRSAALPNVMAYAGPSRMPLVEFMRVAREKHGWATNDAHSLDGLDLLSGLRQEGRDGTIQFWGKARKTAAATADLKTGVIEPIPCTHWSEYQFDGIAVLNARKNGHTCTYNYRRQEWYVGGFIDIYLDGASALPWLASDALKYKGQNNAAN